MGRLQANVTAASRSGVVFVLVALISPTLACDDRSAPALVSRSKGPSSQPASAPADENGGNIRVLIAENVPHYQLSLAGGFDLVEPQTHRSLARLDEARTITASFDGESIMFPGLNLAFDGPAVDVVPHDAKAISTSSGERERRYTGRFRILRGADNLGSVINVLELEEYLVGVVAAELHRGFHTEALRAQAIACRTYAWYELKTGQSTRPWDICATEASQVYRGVDRAEAVPAAASAVRDTRGLVCTWDSPEGRRIFRTFYCSTCGGYTQPAGEVGVLPLQGNVRCDYCRASPYYSWEPVIVTKADITERLRAKYPRFRELGAITRVEPREITPAGRLVWLDFFDAAGDSVALPAESFRLAIDPRGRTLRSTFCTLSEAPGGILFSNGRGFGHGMGMCQYGANGLARQGSKAAEILAYYYPGTHLERAY